MSLTDKYNYLLYVHENNFLNKINENYHNKGSEIKQFYEREYIPLRDKLLGFSFNAEENNYHFFSELAKEMDIYYKKLIDFGNYSGILSQSKLASTFLEEITNYLVKDFPDVASGKYKIVNKNVFVGLSIEKDQVKINKKDVDFCVAKPSVIKLDSNALNIILPIFAIEVKTYLDATMLGEVRSSSKALKAASPNAKAYVLMLYQNIADAKLLVARQEAAVDEIFALQASKNSPISDRALYEFWGELYLALIEDKFSFSVNPPGRLLHPTKNQIIQSK